MGMDPLALGRMSLDNEVRDARIDGNFLNLTPREFELLQCLMQSPSRLVTTRELLEAIWGTSSVGDGHAVEVYVSRLRAKLNGHLRSSEVIRTVRGRGFMFVPPRDPHSIRIEEFSKNGNFMIRAELPGIDPDKDVQINVRDGLLTIEGTREEHTESDQRSEFFYGRFMRTLTLPSGADEKHIKAEYRDGILEVSIPMRESSEKSHTIPISRKD